MTARRLVLALVLVATVLAAGPAGAQAGCITRLPVAVSLPDPYLAPAQQELRVVLTARRGATIRRGWVALYSFGGRKLGVSRVHRTAFRSTRTFVVRLTGARPSGRVTLIATGEPNPSRSCGPKTAKRIVRLGGCPPRLPVAFPDPPGGTVGGRVSTLDVPIAAQGPPVRDLSAQLTDVTGEVLATTFRPLLRGAGTLRFALNRPLTPGSYTVTVTAPDGGPETCGGGSASLALAFD